MLTYRAGATIKLLDQVAATDNVDSSESLQTSLAADSSPAFNPNAAGTYQITFRVSDAAGNAATPVSRSVEIIQDVTPPSLTIGANPLVLYLGGDPISPGVLRNGLFATDDFDGVLTEEITITGAYDLATAGDYDLIYAVEDTAGNQTQITRTVSVREGVPVFAQSPPTLARRAGTDVTLTIVVSGAAPLTLQWYRDGNPLPNTNSATLMLSNVGPADVGDYTVVATNDLAPTGITSAPGTLSLLYELSVAAQGLGTVASVPRLVPGGATVNFTAYPRADAAFIRWSGDVDSTDNPLSVTVDQNLNLVALFGASDVPTQWLLDHGLAADVDLDSDPDGDNLTIRQEYEFGTHPNLNDPETFTLALQPSWHLIALPIQFPVGPDPASLLDSLGGVSSVQKRPPNQRNYSKADRIHARQGIWVEVKTAFTTELTGQRVTRSTMDLAPGWQYVGPATANTLIQVDGVPLGGVRYYDSRAGRLRATPHNAANPLQLGRGYLILLPGPETTIEFAPVP